MLAGLTLVFGIVALFLLNINLTAPHRLYRDQLARTFIHRSDGGAEPVRSRRSIPWVLRPIT